jgi:hypothetical protein
MVSGGDSSCCWCWTSAGLGRASAGVTADVLTIGGVSAATGRSAGMGPPGVPCAAGLLAAGGLLASASALGASAAAWPASAAGVARAWMLGLIGGVASWLAEPRLLAPRLRWIGVPLLLALLLLTPVELALAALMRCCALTTAASTSGWLRMVRCCAAGPAGAAAVPLTAAALLALGLPALPMLDVLRCAASGLISEAASCWLLCSAASCSCTFCSKEATRFCSDATCSGSQRQHRQVKS